MLSRPTARAGVIRLVLTPVTHAPVQRNYLHPGSALYILKQQRTSFIRLASDVAAPAISSKATEVTSTPTVASDTAIHKLSISKRRKSKKNKKKVAIAASTTVDKIADCAEDKTAKVAADVVAKNATSSKVPVPKKKVKTVLRKPMTQKEVEEKMLARVLNEDTKATASVVPTQSSKKNKQSDISTDQTTSETAVLVTKESISPKNLKTETITMTLQKIAALQKTLPSESEIAALITKLRRNSFENAHKLFDLYRNFGNPYLDESFLTPGVLACCEAKKPAEGIHIVRDMLDQGRKVDNSTLRTLFDACDEASAAKEVIELWDLMDKAGMKLELADYNRFLTICYRQEYLDGAVKVLKQLRLLRSVSVHTYMHWLLRASIVWRSDAFFDILMEMRLSEVEPEIMSLTSLESGRKDRALTVMEGVRAVGLDPCFAMASVFSSMQASVYQNGPSYQALTKQDIKDAREKFGDLTPIELDWPVTPTPQVLETQAAGLLLERETFRRLKRQQVNHIDKLLEMLPITTNMTINLRKQLLRMSLLVNTHRVRRDETKICKEYDSGRSLIELSTAHNYPPVSLMRVILRAKGKSQLEIKNALAKPNLILSKRDQRELRKASDYDSIHKSDPLIEAPQYSTVSLERAIEHFLKAKGIRLKTQAELSADQHGTHGRAVMSPDILLLDPVIINGVPIRWIDAKNYYGAHIVSKRLISTQVSNYVKEWGPGAIVFGMGYSDMFSLPGVICLDTTPFPSTRKEAAKLRVKSFLYSCLNAFRWKKHLGSDLTQEHRQAKTLESSPTQSS
ncbi:putative tetratricopeptide-like helical domain superfamily [Plasmopara halstedii]